MRNLKNLPENPWNNDMNQAFFLLAIIKGKSNYQPYKPQQRILTSYRTSYRTSALLFLSQTTLQNIIAPPVITHFFGLWMLQGPTKPIINRLLMSIVMMLLAGSRVAAFSPPLRGAARRLTSRSLSVMGNSNKNTLLTPVRMSTFSTESSIEEDTAVVDIEDITAVTDHDVVEIEKVRVFLTSAN